MAQDSVAIILHYLQTHPGVFALREEAASLEILEIYTKKSLKIRKADIATAETKPNLIKPQEDYLILLKNDGTQTVLCPQGFAFAPDFRSTGPLPLPNQVYCMQDYYLLFSRLQHLASAAEHRKEALEMVMLLLTLLDGAKLIGLDVSEEEQSLEKTLKQIENQPS